jgi:hypothetical protein
VLYGFVLLTPEEMIENDPDGDVWSDGDEVVLVGIIPPPNDDKVVAEWDLYLNGTLVFHPYTFFDNLPPEMQLRAKIFASDKFRRGMDGGGKVH